MFQLPIDVRYPPGKTSSPDEAASWKQHVIKPGKKWCLPIESLCNAESNSLIRVAPISSLVFVCHSISLKINLIITIL